MKTFDTYNIFRCGKNNTSKYDLYLAKYKKKKFKELYGRRPNKEEIKLLKKNLVDIGGIR